MNEFEGKLEEQMYNIPNSCVDMIFADLPYGTTNCKWDSLVDLNMFWKHCWRVLKHNGVVVCTAQFPFTAVLASSQLKYLKYDWVWEKSKATGFLNAKKMPLKAHENILVFYKSLPTYNPQMTDGTPYNKGLRKEQTEDDIYGKFDQVEVKSDGQRYPRSVRYFKTSESEGVTYHKTQKPEALLEYLIKTYTNEGDIVLDPCRGSNTTGVVCDRLNRGYYGIESDPEMFEIGIKRRLK